MEGKILSGIGEHGGKTLIRGTCGHEYPYNVTAGPGRPAASKAQWLASRPCPPCQGKLRKGGKQEPKAPPKAPRLDEIMQETPQAPEPTPEPEPQEEISPEEIDGMLTTFPAIPDGMITHAAMPDVLLAISAGLPVWLQGPPGTGKSTIAEQVATVLKTGFYPLSCHELMTRSDLFGYRDAVGADHRTPLWDAYELGGVFLLDEVDNGNPNLLAALNSALSNGHGVFGSGTIVTRHPAFRVIATANTAGLGPEAGYIGRNAVDLATRDRFVTLMVPIDARLEHILAMLRYDDQPEVDKLRKAQARVSNAAMRKRAAAACRPPEAATLLSAVLAIRDAVEARFRGTVISPRTTDHAAALVHRGFSLREALDTKLVGLDADARTSLLRQL